MSGCGRESYRELTVGRGLQPATLDAAALLSVCQRHLALGYSSRAAFPDCRRPSGRCANRSNDAFSENGGRERIRGAEAACIKRALDVGYWANPGGVAKCRNRPHCTRDERSAIVGMLTRVSDVHIAFVRTKPINGGPSDARTDPFYSSSRKMRCSTQAKTCKFERR